MNAQILVSSLVVTSTAPSTRWIQSRLFASYFRHSWSHQQHACWRSTHCFILQGYSQGAAGTVNALSRLTGASFGAVKGVFLIGDPEHKSGLNCNVDNNGGTATRDVNGLEAYGGGIPTNWISKTLDVCIYVSVQICNGFLNGATQGDGVCDTTHGRGIDQQHLQYSNDPPAQSLGTSFAVKQLGQSVMSP